MEILFVIFWFIISIVGFFKCLNRKKRETEIKDRLTEVDENIKFLLNVIPDITIFLLILTIVFCWSIDVVGLLMFILYRGGSQTMYYIILCGLIFNAAYKTYFDFSLIKELRKEEFSLLEFTTQKVFVMSNMQYRFEILNIMIVIMACINMFLYFVNR